MNITTHRIIYIITVFFILSCSSHESEKSISNSNIDTQAIAKKDSIKKDTNIHKSYNETTSILEEIIYSDSVFVNDIIPFETTTKNLIKKLGKPDSIVTTPYNCGGYFEEFTADVYYYGHTFFESYKDTVVIQIINFTDRRFKLKTTQLVLDNTTSIADIKHFFPHSVEKSNDWVNPIDNKTYRLVRINPKANYDDQWILRFHNDKLIEIEYWVPC